LTSIKLDRAYCQETDCVLTIYQVRDLHFDEEESFNAKAAHYECSDEDCDAALVGVNHTKAEFKNAPHFRLLTGNKHSDACDYGNESGLKTVSESEGNHNERSHKVSAHPEVLLLDRQPAPFGSGKPKKKNNPSAHPSDLNLSPSHVGNEKAAPHETSCLEHIVETWLSNSAEDLRSSLLTIGDKTKYYRNAFKSIEYFTDEEGLIYWGTVKSIKKYGKDYAITFKERPLFDGEKRQISIYISNELIDRYRKRKLFRRYIDSLINHANQNIKCYFVGAYPQLKGEEVITGNGSFRPLDVHLKNLDHVVLRFNEDGEDL
jgi:hypothetical protein